MSDNSQIEWTDATWNPLRGCSRVSQGCVNCYAETVAARFSGPGLPYEGLVDGKGRWNGTVKLVREKLGEPLRWRRPRRIFVNSMSDLFHEAVPNEYIAAVFGVMAGAPQHTFQVLTKRPERMVAFFRWMASHERVPCWVLADAGTEYGVPTRWAKVPPRDWLWPLPNVWLGVSIEDQRTADERIPLLMQCPAAVRWISAEPLLGPVDLTHLDADAAGVNGLCQVDALTGSHTDMGRPCRPVPRVDWVVVGGESGQGARPMHPQWARTIRDACVDSDTPFFFKQWGEWADAGDAHELDEQDTRVMSRVGKRAAGRLLDGREWNEFPR